MGKGILKRITVTVLSFAMTLGNTVSVSAEENIPADTSETEVTETIQEEETAEIVIEGDNSYADNPDVSQFRDDSAEETEVSEAETPESEQVETAEEEAETFDVSGDGSVNVSDGDSPDVSGEVSGNEGDVSGNSTGEVSGNEGDVSGNEGDVSGNEGDIIQYSVTFELDGGTGTIDSITISEGQFISVGATMLSVYDPELNTYTYISGSDQISKEGLVLKGWRLNDDDTVYTAKSTISITADSVLTAVWTEGYIITLDTGIDGLGTFTYEVESGYYIEFNEKNVLYYADAETETVSKQAVIGDLNMPDESRVLLGWHDNAGNTDLDFGDRILVADDMTFTAIWQYAVSFDTTGYTGTIETVKTREGNKVTISESEVIVTDSAGNELSRTGYSISNEGCTLTGWVSSLDNKEYSLGTPITVTGVITLTPVWDTAVYTINFDLNGGEFPEDVSGNTGFGPLTITTGGEVYFGLSDPVRSNYIFEGWSTDSSDSAVVEYSNANTYQFSDFNFESGTDSITLYAVWTAIEYKIMFNPAGGTGEYEPLTVTADSEIVFTAADPVKNHNKFLGWSVDGGADSTVYKSGEVYTLSDFVFSGSNTVVLYAVWEAEEYRILLDPNGGTRTADASGNISEDYQYFYGDEDSVMLWAGDPVRNGYTFAGWSSDGTSAGNVYEAYTEYTLDDFVFDENNTCVLYAVWTADEYTVTFDANGGSFANDETVQETMKVDESAMLTPEIPSRTGYEFIGWAKDAEAAEAEYLNNEEYKNISENGEDITLFAVWAANEYTITFDANGGSFEDSAVTEVTRKFDTPAVLTSSTPVRPGYMFAGWAKSENAYEAEFINLHEYTNISEDGTDITLYAVWELIEYTIILDANGGEFIDDVSGNSGYSTLTVSDEQVAYFWQDEPVRNNYRFIGWSTDGTENGTVYENGKEYGLAEFVFPEGETELTLKAVWEATTYEISFDPNGGNYPDDGSGVTEYEPIIVDPENPIVFNVPDPVRTGYRFIGWGLNGYDASNVFLSGESYTLSDFETEEGAYEIQLYAVWEAEPYTITFDPNGGFFPVDASGNSDVGYREYYRDSGSIWLYSGMPERKGYSFEGWSTDGTSSGKVYEIYEEYSFDDFDFDENNSITLYAVWMYKETHRITYENVSNAENPLLYCENDEIILEDAEKTGYTFGGWYYDSELTQPVTDGELDTSTGADLTVYAKFDANEYVVTFDANGGEFLSDSTSTASVESKSLRSGSADISRSQDMTFDTASKLLEDKPSRGGYKFAGWAKSADASAVVYKSGTSYKNISDIGEDITLYAVYTENKYTVKYDKNDTGLKEIAGNALTISGKTADKKNVYPTMTGLNVQAGYTAPGYAVIGWASDAAASEPDVFDSSRLEDLMKPTDSSSVVTLYAVWQPADYKVTLHSQGSASEELNVITYTVESGVTADQLTDPVMEDEKHYTFEGWFRSTSYKASEKVESIEPGEFGDIDLYAYIVPRTYKLNFSDGASKTTVKTLKYGDTLVFSSVKFTKKGYIPSGWTVGDSDHIEEFNYVLSEETWDSVFADGEYEAAVTQAWAETGTEQGDIYLYWSDSGLPQGLTYEDITNSDETFAYNEAEKAYTAKYTIGTAMKLPVLKEATGNYTFKGWIRTDTNKKVTAVSKSDSGTLKYTAVWTVKNYKLTFNANAPAGSKAKGSMKAVTAAYNTVETVSNTESAFTVDGYEFAGWSMNKDAADSEYSDEFDVEIKGNVTLYAVWKPVEYTAMLFASAGTFEDGTSYKQEIFTKADTTVFEVPEAPFDTIKFDGYYQKTTLKGTKVADSSKLKAAGTELFAKWTGPYTIRYHDERSGKTVLQNTKLESTVTLKANPFKYDGEVFTGWRVRNASAGQQRLPDKLKIAQTFDGLSSAGLVQYMVEESGVLYLDLYAEFEEQRSAEFAVNLFCMGGSINDYSTYKTSYVYGTGITSKEFKQYLTPVMEGYVFQGWYDIQTRKKVTSITKKDAGDKNLYAKWKGAKVKITFDLNNPDSTGNTKVKGSMSAVSTTRGSVITLKKTVLKAEGYEFLGWSAEKKDPLELSDERPSDIKEPGELYYCISMENTVQLHAVWRKKEVQHTFETVGGRIPDENYYATGEPYEYFYLCSPDVATAMPVPVREGYTFSGWYTTSSYKGKAVTKMNMDQETVYFAKWKKN